jgi:hypothetical protein
MLPDDATLPASAEDIIQDDKILKKIQLSMVAGGLSKYELSPSILTKTVLDHLERTPKRHRSGKAKPRAGKKQEAESSGSDSEIDLESARKDAATLLDTHPDEPKQKRARREDATEGSGDGSVSSATGGSQPSRKPGAGNERALSERERDFIADQRAFDTDLVVQSLSRPEAQAMLASLNARLRVWPIDGTLKKNDEHVLVNRTVGTFLRDANKRHQQGYQGQVLQSITEVNEDNWPLDDGFDAWLDGYFECPKPSEAAPASASEPSEAAPASGSEPSEAAPASGSEPSEAAPASAPVTGPVNQDRRRYKRMLPNSAATYRPKPEHPYKNLSFRFPSPSQSVLVLMLRKTMTRYWDRIFPELCTEKTTDLRFAVLINPEIYATIPVHIRESLLLETTNSEDKGFTFFLLDGVVEQGGALSAEWMRALCMDKTDLKTIYTMCDAEIRKRLLWNETSVHEHVEGQLLGVIRQQIREHNNDIVATEKKRARQARQDREAEADPEKRKRKIKIGEKMNGNLALGPLMELPTQITVVCVPFVFALMCANNMLFGHGPACYCCGEGIVNPITGPLFNNVVRDPTADAIRRLKTTLPRHFLNGLCNCFPLCNTNRKPTT